MSFRNRDGNLHFRTGNGFTDLPSRFWRRRVHPVLDDPLVTAAVGALNFQHTIAEIAGYMTRLESIGAEHPELDLPHGADEEEKLRRKFLDLSAKTAKAVCTWKLDDGSCPSGE